jgi:RHS repeat-associated protein
VPFGMTMPGRKFESDNYRYGFNGKENDNEVKGESNQQDYGMRIYDPRLGRFLSEDPITSDYPELTPYQFASNEPIAGIDLDGLERVRYNAQTGKRDIGPYTGDDAKNGWYLNPAVGTSGYWTKFWDDRKLVEAQNKKIPIFTFNKPDAEKAKVNKNSGAISKTTDKISAVVLPIQKKILSPMATNNAALGVSKKLNWVANYYPNPNTGRVFEGNQYTWGFKYTKLNNGIKSINNGLTTIGAVGDFIDYKNGNTGDYEFSWQMTKLGIGLKYPWAGVGITVGESMPKSLLGQFTEFLKDQDKKAAEEKAKKVDKEMIDKQNSYNIGPKKD